MSFPVKLVITNSSSSMSISAAQNIIGFVVAILLNLGLLFLGLTSLAGAFLPGCPFRSAFSIVIRYIFEKPRTFFKWILHGCLSLRLVEFMWILTLSLFCYAPTLSVIQVNASVVLNAVFSTGIWSSLLILIISSYSLEIATLSPHAVAHKPQKYKMTHLVLWIFLSSSVVMTLVMWSHAKWVSDYIDSPLMWALAVIGQSILSLAILMHGNITISMADTGEIDAIAWLLKTAPPQNPAAFFKKAGQMTGFRSIGCHYRPRLLESLMPFLSLLIISHHVPNSEHPSSEADTHSPSSPNDEDQDLKNLEKYTACLARLSEFTDSEGSFMYLWEDTMKHPKLEQPLIDKLVQLANLDPRNRFRDGLRSAATKVLNNYELDMEGKSVTVEGPARNIHGVSTVLMNAALWMLNVSGLIKERQHMNLPVELEYVEPPHSSGDIEEAYDSGNSGM